MDTLARGQIFLTTHFFVLFLDTPEIQQCDAFRLEPNT